MRGSWKPLSVIVSVDACIKRTRSGSSQAPALYSTLQLTQFVRVDMGLAKKAAKLKASRKMSYADCFAAVLARLRKAALVTGDKEFSQVEGEVKVLRMV